MWWWVQACGEKQARAAPQLAATGGGSFHISRQAVQHMARVTVEHLQMVGRVPLQGATAGWPLLQGLQWCAQVVCSPLGRPCLTPPPSHLCCTLTWVARIPNGGQVVHSCVHPKMGQPAHRGVGQVSLPGIMPTAVQGGPMLGSRCSRGVLGRHSRR